MVVNATEAALDLVRAERGRQDLKWGTQRHLPFDRWMTILVEEVGEAAQEIMDGSPSDLRNELVQVAAVAVNAIEHLNEVLDQ